MSFKQLVAVVLALSLTSLSAFAELTDLAKALGKIKTSAQVREKFVNAYGYGFGSDEMSRVKRHIADAGFSSITAVLRLALQDAKSSFVFAPTVRSSISDVEVLITRMNMSGHGIILKPAIVTDSDGINVTTRLTGIDPKNPRMFLDTYYRAIRGYVQIARTRAVTEIVVGTGLSNLWKPQYADFWINTLKDIRQTIAPRKTILSFEISSELDMQAFDNWSKKDPASFKEMLSVLDKVRLSMSPQEGTAGNGDWNNQLNTSKINDLLEKAQKLFPGKIYSLANVTIPGCRTRNILEDEVECVNDPNIQDGFYDYPYQQTAYDSWTQTIEELPLQTLALIQEIEFVYAVTEFDPGAEHEDPRFLVFNKKVKESLLKKTK